MENYAIVWRTNRFIANRDRMFNGKCDIVVERNLSYENAQQTLLDMYNERYEDELGYVRSLSEAYKRDGERVEGMSHSLESFTYDSRTLSIELMED